MTIEKKANFLGEEPTYEKGGIKMFDKMKVKMKKVLKNEKGMTLIELLAVIVIIAIIALIAVPAIGNIINNSKDKAILSDASTIISGAKIAIADGACTSSTDNSNKTTISCDKGALENYVEKADLPASATYSVTKQEVTEGTAPNTTTRVDYVVSYSKFSELKKSDYSAVKTAQSVNSKELARLMGNK